MWHNRAAVRIRPLRPIRDRYGQRNRNRPDDSQPDDSEMFILRYQAIYQYAAVGSQDQLPILQTEPFDSRPNFGYRNITLFFIVLSIGNCSWGIGRGLRKCSRRYTERFWQFVLSDQGSKACDG
jgi:hypothetical protein